jgi:hypothetical protein
VSPCAASQVTRTIESPIMVQASKTNTAAGVSDRAAFRSITSQVTSPGTDVPV